MPKSDEPTAAQLRAVNEAQTPEEYAAAAKEAGLTADAEAAFRAGAHAVTAPDFAEQVRKIQSDNAAQIAALEASFNAQLEALRAGVPGPAVDPRIPVAANFAAGVADLLATRPGLPRAEALEAAHKQLAEVLAAAAEGGDPPADADVSAAVAAFRKVAAASPALETGIYEHAAQLVEAQYGL